MDRRRTAGARRPRPRGPAPVPPGSRSRPGPRGGGGARRRDRRLPVRAAVPAPRPPHADPGRHRTERRGGRDPRTGPRPGRSAPRPHRRRGRVRIHLGTPAFYVKSADALLLARRERIIQAAAGVWAEWLFTSLVAIWLWRFPVPLAVPLLHRFVILNAATIATNLIPFTGLDGAWLLADITGTPDLSRRARGSVTRLLTAVAGQQPVTGEAWLLAAYCTVNGLVAAVLLATAGFFWYQLFGDLTATLLHHGPAGWLVLAAGAVILGRPAATSAAARLPDAWLAARELRHAVRFRLQWRWRIAATRQLAATPRFAGLTGAQLGVLAGQLRRTRHRGPIPLALAATCGVVVAGAVTCAPAPSDPRPLTAGATWDERQRLSHAVSRAILVHLPAPTPGALAGG